MAPARTHSGLRGLDRQLRPRWCVRPLGKLLRGRASIHVLVRLRRGAQLPLRRGQSIAASVGNGCRGSAQGRGDGRHLEHHARRTRRPDCADTVQRRLDLRQAVDRDRHEPAQSSFRTRVRLVGDRQQRPRSADLRFVRTGAPQRHARKLVATEARPRAERRPRRGEDFVIQSRTDAFGSRPPPSDRPTGR